MEKENDMKIKAPRFNLKTQEMKSKQEFPNKPAGFQIQ